MGPTAALGWTALLLVLVQGQSYDECLSMDCSGSDCTPTPCAHGSCADDGSCECLPCWTGLACDIYRNAHYPEFTEPEYYRAISPDTSAGEVVLSVRSVDEDRYVTCQSHEEIPGCTCAQILYSIESGNDDNLFAIDRWTGDLRVLDGAYLHPGRSYNMKISAQNVEPEEGSWSGQTGYIPLRSFAVGTVRVKDDLDQDWDTLAAGGGAAAIDAFQSHHRSKRAIPAMAENATFYLTKEGEYENVTTIQVGSKIHFKLKIHFPDGETDMLVELFTPDSDTTVMTICNPVISWVGSNLDQGLALITPVMDSKDGSYNYDRAIIDMGNVTNNHASSTTDAEESMVHVEWDAVMIENNATVNASTYWVSAGAEYNNDYEIWVGQAAFTTIIDNEMTGETPIFNFTGPSSMEIGSSAVFAVDMYIPYPSVNLVFDAFAPLNDSGVMSVCSLSVVDTGPNYECLVTKDMYPKLYLAEGSRGNEQGQLVIGTVTNKGSRENSPMADSLIRVEFVMYLYDDESYVGRNFFVGAALQLGTDQIWAGQIAVTAIPRAIASMAETPTVSLDVAGGNIANSYVGGVIIFDIDLEVPASTDSEYELELLMPCNTSAPQIKVCSASVVYQGINVPCMGQEEPVYTSRYGTDDFDRVVWPLGRILNSGHRDTTYDPHANLLRVQFVVQVIDHPDNVAGAQPWVTANLKYDTSRLSVAQHAVVLAAPPNATFVNETTPEFNMFYIFGDENVAIGALTQVQLDITTKQAMVYSPVELEIIMPFENDSAVYTICKAEVIHVGKNLPCANIDQLNENFNFTTKGPDGSRWDKALLSLGQVCNTRGLNSDPIDPWDQNAAVVVAAGDPLDDVIQVTFTLRVESHVNNVDGAKNWVSTGVQYDDSRMWIGQLALFVVDAPNKDYVSGSPHLEVIRGDDNDTANFDVGIGDAFSLYVLIKPPSGSTADITVWATVANPDISLCHIRIKEVGLNLGCVDDIEGNYTIRAGTVDTYEEAFISVPKLTNVGNETVVADGVVDNNTLLVEVIGLIHPTLSNGASRTVTIKLDTGSDGSFDMTQPVAMTAVTGVLINATTNDTMPSFTFALAPIANETTTQNVVKGETKRFFFDLYLAPYSKNRYVVKFLGPINYTGAMEVCDMAILSVGKNAPCVKRDLFTATYENRPGSYLADIATIDLGPACHYQISDDPADNIIRFEAFAKLTRDTNVPEAGKVWFSGTSRINEDQIYVSQLALVVDNILNFTETYHDTSLANATLNTSQAFLWSPGQTYTLTVSVTVPPSCAILGNMDVKLPINDSAIMTLSAIRLVSAGANLACLASRPDDEYVPEYNSTLGTSQSDKGVLDVGVVVNTGITYRSGEYQAGDDTFTLEVEIQMADSVVNQDGSTHELSVGVRLGSSIFLLNQLVTVVRTNTEQPDLLLTANVTSIAEPYTDASTVTIMAILRHTENSTAEAYTVAADFFFPPYMAFDAILSNNLSQHLLQVNNASGDYGISFVFERVYFTDIVMWVFTLRVSEAPGTKPRPGEQSSLAPYEATSNMIWRQNHVNDSGAFFVTRLDHLSFRVVPPLAISCAEAHLGMASGDIADCQIAGSYSPISGKVPAEARPGGANGWVPGRRGSKYQQYLQVYFGNVTKVSSVALQYKGSGRVTEYKLFYSDDGRSWQAGESILPNPALPTPTDNVTSPLEARYLRLVVVSSTGVTSDVELQAEFNGCFVSQDVSPADICKRRKSWEKAQTEWPAAMKIRSFLVAGSSMFFCDVNPNKEDKLECFSSLDGVEWRDVDKRVINVIGYDSLTDELYGIAWDRRSIVLSEDQGNTWFSVPKSRYDQVSAEATWKEAQDVDWLSENGLDPGLSEPDVSMRDAAWGGHFRGVFKNALAWRPVVDWDECCA